MEVQHHTPDQVAAYIKDAHDLAMSDDIADELREAVFVEAVRLISSKTVQAVAVPTGIHAPILGH